MAPLNPHRSSASRAAAAPREHLSGYQSRDYEVIDYHLQQLPGVGLWFRGPLPETLDRGEYFSCIGAAQTFGCFCPAPYPALLAQQLGLPALNLGYGGAGPEFFARHPGLLEYVNRGRFLILQVMSGRSQSNSLFESGGLELLRRRSDGVTLGARQAYEELLAGPPFLRRLPPHRLGRWLARRVAARSCLRLAAETRAAWIDSHRCLLAQIRVPTVLFWFSKRTPDHTAHTRHLRGFFGAYPQLIDRATLASVQQLVPRYVECVTARGSPQPLRSRFTGRPIAIDPARDRPDLAAERPWTHNDYYPAPEMHQDAAEALLRIARGLVQAPVAQA